MYIDTVTITGADDDLDIHDLYGLSNAYKKVEWGILYAREKEGSPRFPSNKWALEFDNWAPRFVNRSVHLCKSAAINMAVSGDMTIVRDSAFHWPTYERIQVNTPPEFIDSMNTSTIANNIMRGSRVIPVILQLNRKTLPVLQHMFLVADEGFDIHILFDASRGRGKFDLTEWEYLMESVSRAMNQRPSKVKTCDIRLHCGFAGGIDPENVFAVMTFLDVAKDSFPFMFDHTVWIDMESGVRTNNQVDLKKVELVLEATK